MPLDNNSELKRQVVVDSRENGISYTLFRNAVGKKLGLNVTDFEGLDLIFYRGVATPSELSKYTGLSSGSTTAMIDRLEKSGLVKRQNNPDDRRGTLVVLDKEAALKVRPLFTSARVAQNKLLDGYSSQELKVLSNYFKKSATMFEVERKNVQTTTQAIKKI
ncbi:MAG TPA: MarR family transcriptional regulator [Candidatus Saccharimonadales bacterium]|jgi:DNA-binding MarR family transcriptional regulator|nr:MarR family transcriptional regulator [Candidatus Saccharimonadales bacterium]